MFYSYAPESGLGIVKGFYMAVNIGYSIGFGYPEEQYLNYLFFSSVYVLVGSRYVSCPLSFFGTARLFMKSSTTRFLRHHHSFVAMALGFFADKISEDHDNWFTNLIQQKEYEEAFVKGSTFSERARAVFDQHAPTLRAVSVWLIALGMMIAYSMLEVGWSFKEAQYFAIGTLSTGGLWRIPDDSSTLDVWRDCGLRHGGSSHHGCCDGRSGQRDE